MKRQTFSLLLVVGMAAQVAAQQPPNKPADAAAVLKQIEEETQETRGLKFKTPVLYKTMEKAKVIEFLKKKLHEEASAEELQNKSRACQMLGLLPPGFDLENELLSLLGEQVGAFYDHDTKALTTFSDQQLGEMFQRPLLAHELTHALQDQNFDFSKFPEMKMKDNDDRQRAFQSLFEGDATLIMEPILKKHLDMNNPLALFKQVQDMMKSQSTEKLDAAPPFLRDTLIFSYTGGKEFAESLYAKTNDYELVNKAYTDLPKSTEQILHPEKYLDAAKRDNPKDITLPKLNSPHWKMIDNNVLGELGIRLVFSTAFAPPPKAKAKADGDDGNILAMLGKMMETANSMKPSPVPAEGITAAAGWGGDRYQVFAYKSTKQNAGAEPLALRWATAWDTEEDALEFSDMMSQVYKKRFPDISAKEEMQNGRRVLVLENKDWRITVARQGEKVTILQAPPPLFGEFSGLVQKAAK